MGAIFTCSVDDGHPSDLKMADLLAKHGLQATFYIPLNNREGLPVMSTANMCELDRLFEIGSHTYDHCYLKNLGKSEAEYQVIEGKRSLEDVLGHTVAGFCYPGGQYAKRHASLVRNAGFRYARTIRNFCFDPGEKPFEMPTTIQFYPHQNSVYLRNFARGGEWASRIQGLNVALRQESWISRLYALFDYASRNGTVFHVWCHSHDIDIINAWDVMDRFLAHVSAHVSKPDRLTNLQLADRFYFSREYGQKSFASPSK